MTNSSKCNLLLVIIIPILFCGCEKRTIRQNITGHWNIYVMEHDYYSNMNNCIISPTVDIYNDCLECPSIDSLCLKDISYAYRMEWELFMSDGLTFITIKNGNDFFSGFYRLKFLYDKRTNRIFMDLKSDHQHFVMEKITLSLIDTPSRKQSKGFFLVGKTKGDFVDWGTWPFE